MSTRVEILGVEECYRLLGGATMGRVGVSVSAIPEILPVNYALLDASIVFRTGAGTKLYAATRQAPIAFEIDESDAVTRSGWSVLAVGFAQEVTDEATIARALTLLHTSWVPGGEGHVVRLTPSRISGRRIQRGADD